MADIEDLHVGALVEHSHPTFANRYGLGMIVDVRYDAFNFCWLIRVFWPHMILGGPGIVRHDDSHLRVLE